MLLQFIYLFSMQAHPAAKPFINKPIENYEGLKIICGDDTATGSYATSLYSDFGEKYGSEDNENDNESPNEQPNEQPNSEGDGDGNSVPHVPSSPATSSTFRAQRAKGAKNNSMMSELVNVVGEMAAAIKCPTHWSETLYAKDLVVMAMMMAKSIVCTEAVGSHLLYGCCVNTGVETVRPLYVFGMQLW
ncbi:hypothetical protein IHE45_04G167500 [Dioscorea alata]|uniref:Uncharacterized protein n=1 Tax=Dioscorea alata TaxID=55571 RepID=A0ACB7WID9_DIOAL|nr:hypothetical protein IHE45_04G167500 [Dioscorea alata]